jgi:hypothetical protein
MIKIMDWDQRKEKCSSHVGPINDVQDQLRCEENLLHFINNSSESPDYFLSPSIIIG